MAAPQIFRSTDTGAPILNACAGAALNVLSKCLVDGYGSTAATATVTSSGTNVSNNDTVTVDGTTYTFKTALTPAANEVLIGASAAASLVNLAAAMSGFGTSGTTYGTGTTQQTRVQVTAVTATVITLTAFTGGTGGNSLAVAKSAATLTLSGATLTGGTGSNATASLGWGRPFASGNRAAFRAATGARHYLDVDDSAPDTSANGRNFRVRGYETMTAVGTGTGLFPTTTQATNSVGLVKSTTADSVNRPWLLIGDGLTFYLFVESAGAAPPNLTTHTWTTSMFFGEVASVVAGDTYRSILGFQNITSTTTTASQSVWLTVFLTQTTAPTTYMARSYTGSGTAIHVALMGNAVATTSASIYQIDGASLPFPNTVDGGFYVTDMINMYERGSGTTPSTIVAGAGCRGRLRGVFQQAHSGTGIDDQSTFTGVGVFTGTSFIFVKTTNGGLVFTTNVTWDTTT